MASSGPVRHFPVSQYDHPNRILLHRQQFYLLELGHRRNFSNTYVFGVPVKLMVVVGLWIGQTGNGKYKMAASTIWQNETINVSTCASERNGIHTDEPRFVRPCNPVEIVEFLTEETGSGKTDRNGGRQTGITQSYPGL